jgi:hypothetical protein
MFRPACPASRLPSGRRTAKYTLSTWSNSTARTSREDSISSSPASLARTLLATE